jgi:uncharacterized protein YqgC (DUF456 family)
MDILIDVLYALGVIILSVLGFLGCVVPVIPGPVMSYAAMLILLPSRFAPSTDTCIWMGIGCVTVLLLDTIVPVIGAKKFNCSRWGVSGCVIGTIIGMFFGLLGLILGPFTGAVIGELIAGKNFFASIRGGFGAFLGFLSGVLLKVVYCAICAIWCGYAFYDVLFK